MTMNVTSLQEIDRFLSDRCVEARRRLETIQPVRQDAIEYNNKLAEHWQPGIKTRSHELEEAELEAFLRMVKSDWLAKRRQPSRPTDRALIIDLGGGNGKVVEWIGALSDQLGYEVAYIYTDISPRMMAEAEARFVAMKSERSGRPLQGYFTLADITQPFFSAEDWETLRRTFFPIITVCAGGTIGNFGELDASDNSAQDLVFRNYVQPADASVVTFLDPLRVDKSLNAYSTFGGKTGMYDGQEINAYTLSGTRSELSGTWVVPFQSDGTVNGMAAEVVRHARSSEEVAFWLKLDMVREGRKVGQVTRHYSERYARKRFLRNADILELRPCNRAYIAAFAVKTANSGKGKTRKKR